MNVGKRAVADAWDGRVFERSRMHADLAALLSPQRWRDWPRVEQLNALLTGDARTAAGRAVRFVPQPDAGRDGAAAYEQGIHASGEVPTRPASWHDLFNAFMWALFPASKAALNGVHIRELREESALRSPRRDAVTLLDECGVVVPVADRRLTRLHAAHRWRELFVGGRRAWGRSIDAMIIGHGLYEQALRPYIGLTAKALHVAVPAAWFSQPLAVRYRQVDAMLAGAIEAGDALMATSELQPLPVLGVPGWWEANSAAAFYDNEAYFRPASGKPRQ